MELSKDHIERLRELLARPAQRIVILSHTNPDGDAVGSSLAWAEVLRGMGHAVTCIVPNKYPYFLDWMPGIEEVVVFKTDTEGRAARAVSEADIFFCLDFNAVSRLENLSETIEANTTAVRVLIDHHPTCRQTRVSTWPFRTPIRRAPASWSTVSSRRCAARMPSRSAWANCSTSG